tara:strand:+ start:9480 stop:9710 length:231 start_codon:yes stop_codon:yes gene_type:complete
MSTEIRIPKLGISMDEAILTEWMAKDGDSVTEGSPLYAIETDKSVQDVDAPASGTLSIIGETGETYEVGALIGRID